MACMILCLLESCVGMILQLALFTDAVRWVCVKCCGYCMLQILVCICLPCETPDTIEIVLVLEEPGIYPFPGPL